MLNGTVLSKAQTRRWMHSATFASDVNVGVGAPWEIFRAQVGGQTVDIYTKSGGLGAYATLFVLVPDYEFGFSILTASTIGEGTTVALVYFIAEMIGSTVLPVLEKVAKDQAKATFAGHYAASNLNSSLTITVDDQPGLRVIDWVSNGTDFLEKFGHTSDGTYVDFRIQPNQLYTGNKVGFNGVSQILPAQIYSGPLRLNCLSWTNVDRANYGNVGIGEFAFEIDPATGNATSVQPKALRINLERKGEAKDA